MQVLIAYDGSADADAAIAARMYAGASAVVVGVWEGFSEVVARSGSGLAVAALDFAGIDRAAEQRAQECAEAGAGRARAAGLAAQPLWFTAGSRCGGRSSMRLPSPMRTSSWWAAAA